MPSLTHEALLLLFRNRPELAPELIRDALHVELPAYIAGLRARLSCAACVLVVTVNEDIAQWSRELTDAEVATRDPELAVLSIVAHGLSSEAERLARVALEAVQWLDAERQVLYSDLVFAALGEATRVALEELMASGNYVFQSEFAKRHQAKGREEGRVEGRAEALLTVLEGRGLVLSEQDRARIRACSQLETLDEWLRRAATIDSVDRLFI